MPVLVSSFQLQCHTSLSELDLLFLWRLCIFILITQLGINSLGLRRLPRIREQRVILGFVRILEQRLAGILLAHGAERDAFPDGLLVRLVLGKGRCGRYMRSSRVARLARRREADGRVARRERAAALDGFAARARVDDGVA